MQVNRLKASARNLQCFQNTLRLHNSPNLRQSHGILFPREGALHERRSARDYVVYKYTCLCSTIPAVMYVFLEDNTKVELRNRPVGGVGAANLRRGFFVATSCNCLIRSGLIAIDQDIRSRISCTFSPKTLSGFCRLQRQQKQSEMSWASNLGQKYPGCTLIPSLKYTHFINGFWSNATFTDSYSPRLLFLSGLSLIVSIYVEHYAWKQEYLDVDSSFTIPLLDAPVW